MRALLYENLRGLEGPRLIARDLLVRLSRIRAVGSTRARCSRLRAPATRISKARCAFLPTSSACFGCQASAELDSLRVEVATAGRASERSSAPVCSAGRCASLQQFSEGPVQAESGALAPSIAPRARGRWRVRARGGVSPARARG
jgi:hypothetical protein